MQSNIDLRTPPPSISTIANVSLKLSMRTKLSRQLWKKDRPFPPKALVGYKLYIVFLYLLYIVFIFLQPFQPLLATLPACPSLQPSLPLPPSIPPCPSLVPRPHPLTLTRRRVWYSSSNFWGLLTWHRSADGLMSSRISSLTQLLAS